MVSVAHPPRQLLQALLPCWSLVRADCCHLRLIPKASAVRGRRAMHPRSWAMRQPRRQCHQALRHPRLRHPPRAATALAAVAADSGTISAQIAESFRAAGPVPGAFRSWAAGRRLWAGADIRSMSEVRCQASIRANGRVHEPGGGTAVMTLSTACRRWC